MKEIKLKRQSRWVVRSLMLLGVLLGGIFAFVSRPIGGAKANLDSPDIVYYDVAGNEKAIMTYDIGSYKFGENGYGGSLWELGDRGPCPDGYHVPTFNELKNLFYQRIENHDGVYNATNFQLDYNFNSYSFLWSSTRFSLGRAYSFDLYRGKFNTDEYGGGGSCMGQYCYRRNVRCLAGEYDMEKDPIPMPLEVYSTDGNLLDTVYIPLNQLLPESKKEKLRQYNFGLNLDEVVFTYADVIYDGEKVKISLVECEDGYYSRYGQCIPQGVEYGIYYNNGYIKVTDGINTYYVKDRNQGADEAYNGALNTASFGNYYYRGNNVGASSYDLEIAWGSMAYWYGDLYSPISAQLSMIASGFDGGNLFSDEETGWEIGSEKGNPCNQDAGEYLPTASDWEELSDSIFGIINYDYEYSFLDNTYGDGFNIYYRDLLMIPSVGMLSNIYGNTDSIYFNPGTYFWSAKDSDGRIGLYGRIFDSGAYSYYNNFAAPVRCFIDPDYVEGAVKYTVTFDMRGGNEIIPSQVRVQGKKLKEPTIPTKDGYTFAGWYTSDGKKWNFDEDVVENEMTLYAKWRLCGVGFIVENNQCIPEGIEFNGVIKVTDGERTMYVRDRNVGVTSDAAVAFLKLDFIRDKYNDLWDYQCNNQCYSQCNSYGDCYEMCYDECYNKNFLEVVEKEIGVSYESVDDAYNLLQLEVLKGLLPEKELEAYVLISNFDTISDQCAGNIFVDPFRNVDECVHNEMIRYINETFQLDHELQNMDDVENWVSEYFGMEEFNKFTLRYNNGYYNGLIYAQAFGNYYYRGNNSGVNYNDLEFEKPLDGNFSIINIDELVAKGFDGGNIGGDGLGWISGNVNPCDPEKGEYLPTPEDWKDLMGIWGNANGYSLGDESTILRNLDDYREYNYFFGESQHREFQSELLIPYGGNIYKDTNFVSVFDNAWFPLRTSQDDEGNMGVYNRNGRWGGLYYTHYKKFIDDGWNELYAMPVRCFVNLAEISDVYVVSYETNGGNIIGDVNVIGGDTVILPTPTRDNYTFDGWYTDRALTNSFASTTPVTSDLTLYAKWSVKQSTSSNGGAGGYIRKDSCPNGDYTDSYYDGKCGKRPSTSSGTNVKDKKGHNSADEVEYDSSNYNPKYSDEINQAYQYAYHYGITTKNNIKDASMNGKLTRVAMAKMLSQYAINVLGMKPDTSRQNKFADVTDNLDTKYNNGVTLAYQLGIMGINMQNNEFKPYNYVTRGEFVTALSRLLYKTSDGEYRSTARYYTNHIKKLENEGIITKVDPYMKELRGYVMLMLMRSAK